jgi:hypothetical protein
MTTLNFQKTFLISAALFSTYVLQAQQASNNQPVDEKQKIFVDFRIAPSVKEFKAGIASVESCPHKLRLWICNGEERKCTISFSSGSGYLWTGNFRDAYYNQVFDLSLLDDGDYFIKVNNGKDVFEKKIIIATNSYVQRDFKIE